ncbi:isochorismatase family protein [Streptomyces sp. NBC_00322]|uniref:isochorismatase family protein n=1 Tax=Streptomyces sp. NBC_00322 TaxID=2975712 RepID=UPI002E2941B6|nr:isochorismatase family protein [Streptomyces sp. NBC_00322]
MSTPVTGMAAAAGPPANTARWSVDPDRAVLLIHDMQRYVLAPLPHSLRGELVHNTALLRAQCRVHGIPTAYTAADAFSHDFQTFLVPNAVAGFSLDGHRMALSYAARCCAMVITTKEALA